MPWELIKNSPHYRRREISPGIDSAGLEGPKPTLSSWKLANYGRYVFVISKLDSEFESPPRDHKTLQVDSQQVGEERFTNARSGLKVQCSAIQTKT